MSKTDNLKAFTPWFNCSALARVWAEQGYDPFLLPDAITAMGSDVANKEGTPERIAEKLEEIAQNMGNDGYCAYEPCREYLRQAYELGRRETVEECAKIAESAIGARRREVAEAIRALLPAATREETTK